MSPTPLSDTGVAAALSGRPGWAKVAGRLAIAKKFQFADFNAAWGFMSRVWNRVETTLSTHDAGGLSARVKLAEAIEKVV